MSEDNKDVEKALVSLFEATQSEALCRTFLDEVVMMKSQLFVRHMERNAMLWLIFTLVLVVAIGLDMELIWVSRCAAGGIAVALVRVFFIMLDCENILRQYKTRTDEFTAAAKKFLDDRLRVASPCLQAWGQGAANKHGII